MDQPEMPQWQYAVRSGVSFIVWVCWLGLAAPSCLEIIAAGGEDRTAQEYFTLSVLFGIVLTILAMAGIGLFHERLLRFFGADDELIVLAKQYFIPLFSIKFRKLSAF